MFGTGNLGTLFGIVFFSHQVGAFSASGSAGSPTSRRGPSPDLVGRHRPGHLRRRHPWPIVESRARFATPQPEA